LEVQDRILCTVERRCETSDLMGHKTSRKLRGQGSTVRQVQKGEGRGRREGIREGIQTDKGKAQARSRPLTGHSQTCERDSSAGSVGYGTVEPLRLNQRPTALQKSAVRCTVQEFGNQLRPAKFSARLQLQPELELELELELVLVAAEQRESPYGGKVYHSWCSATTTLPPLCYSARDSKSQDCERKVPDSRFSTHFYCPPYSCTPAGQESSVGCTHTVVLVLEHGGI
jgi:hypothetical protein